MRFALTVETSVGVADRTHVINTISEKMVTYFLDKNYGHDVLEILIGVICVAPEFEWFAKVRKPKYVFNRRHVRDHLEIVEDRLFSFNIKIDYESFYRQSDEQNRTMLAFEIVRSLSNLDSLPKRVKDFDKEGFKRDVQEFFQHEGLSVENPREQLL